MDRRELLQLLFLATAGTACSNFGKVVPVATPSNGRSKGKAMLVFINSNKNQSVLRIWDWDTKAYQDYLIPLSLPHSYFQDKNDPDVVFLFELLGSCARVNLKTNEVLKIDQASGDGLFTGHAVQSNSGDVILCNQLGNNANSFIALRSSKTMELMTIAPDECHVGHHLTKMPETSMVACGNIYKEGEDSAGGVTFYDYEKNTVLKSVKCEYPVLHVFALSPEEVIGVTLSPDGEANTKYNRLQRKSSIYMGLGDAREVAFSQLHIPPCAPSPLFYAKTDGTKKYLWGDDKKDLLRFNNSLSKISNTEFMTTHLQSNSVLLWKDNKVVKTLNHPSPNRILFSADGSEFMVLGGAQLTIYSYKTFLALENIHYPQMLAVGISGYHEKTKVNSTPKVY